jgi:hypothetical protein
MKKIAKNKLNKIKMIVMIEDDEEEQDDCFKGEE